MDQTNTEWETVSNPNPVKHERLAGFFEFAPNAVCQGKYEGTFTSKGGKFGPKKIHRVRLTSEAMVTDNGDTVKAPIGSLIGVDDRGRFKALGKEVQLNAEFNIRIIGKGEDGKWTYAPLRLKKQATAESVIK